MRLSAYHIESNQLRTQRIVDVKTTAPNVKTYVFKDRQCSRARPGQFLMLWIPGIDEIPFSVMDTKEDGTVAVAVKRVGEATQKLHNMKAGEIVGIRGPFGNSFTEKKGKILIVGGGTGLAPLLFLTKRLHFEASKLVFVAGAKTKGQLLFVEELEQLCGKGGFLPATEDGSYGTRCLATDPVESILIKERFDMVYTCGPEQMMLKVTDMALRLNMPLEASLERLMRCAIGLCGSCLIGKYRVCRDGPVFTGSQLAEARGEFGKTKRDFDGRKVHI